MKEIPKWNLKFFISSTLFEPMLTYPESKPKYTLSKTRCFYETWVSPWQKSPKTDIHDQGNKVIDLSAMWKGSLVQYAC